MKYTFMPVCDSTFEKKFLQLPKMLYDKYELTQNDSVEKQLLQGIHPLSKDVTLTPFLLVDADKKPVARCILTYYPGSDTAYLGFFECIYDYSACKMLLDAACDQARQDLKTSIIGPVDVSFWIKYRFKTDLFDGHPYAMEPYNKSYYPVFWERWGFQQYKGYFSNQIRMPTVNDHDAKCQKRFDTMLKRGYTIENPTSSNFNEKLQEVFVLLSKLYSKFPCYSELSWENFFEMHSSIKHALNFDMAKLVYKDGKLVGFSISVPNFGNAACGKLTLEKLYRIFKEKHYPKEFILIYMGVDDEHLGLGSMIAESVKRSLAEKKCSAINALILDGKVTGVSYYNSSLTIDRYHYALYQKIL